MHRIINIFLNVCHSDYNAFVGRGKVLTVNRLTTPVKRKGKTSSKNTHSKVNATITV